ncbi:MAG: signal recognition particle-docking protein FtsY [Spirochaetales bacterium]|nr:signal recognition particle-docking protein FtsY [Spirochaetales bacterium]
MKKSSLGERLRSLFRRPEGDDARFDDLLDLLIEADVGAAVASAIVADVKRESRERRASDEETLVALCKDMMRSWISAADIVPVKDALNVVLVLGVNGVGKTTTIAKLASFFRKHYGLDDIVLAAADTFRAAAAEQLALWGERLGLKVVRQAQGADPGAVVYDSLESAKSRHAQLLFIDTSGRMHNKEQLVRELVKIDRIATGRRDSAGLYHRMLVIDATTGQNALRQAEVFKASPGIDSIALAKFDSSAKGGIAVAVGKELGLPVSFVGNGERLEDIEPFRTDTYLSSLFGEI